jgi:S-adenosylmethionine hydrolase
MNHQKKAPLLSILSDFPAADPRLGVLKALLHTKVEAVQDIDLGVGLPAGDTTQAALHLWAATEFFPPGSIHLVAVDVHATASERLLLVRAGGQYFLGPDNGVMWPALERFVRQDILVLNKEEWHREPVNTSFQERDILLQIAIHLLQGVAFDELGTPEEQMETLELWDAKVSSKSANARILYETPEGHLVTNLRKGLLRNHFALDDSTLYVGPYRIQGIQEEINDLDEGDVVAIFNAFELLEIRLVGGYAAAAMKGLRDRSVLVDFV